MKTSKTVLWVSIVSILLLLSCSNDKDCNERWSSGKLNALAQDIGKDVCKTSHLTAGENCRALVVFEENHLSVSGQIEQAIAFVRLHDKYGLQDIAVEAYLKTDEEINVDWFIKATKGDTISKVGTAIALLKEGEISAAEFMKLVYNDIRIHKTEKSEDYNVEIDDKATSAPVHFLSLLTD